LEIKAEVEMIYSLSIEINGHIETIAGLLGDHEAMMKWMPELAGYELLSGKPRHVGAKTKLLINAPGMGGIIETVQAIDFPKHFKTYYEMEQGSFTADSNLMVLNAGKTLYTLNHEFKFKGMLKLATAVMKPAFINHSQKLLQNFKAVAEST
jgi:hypothetical protein